MAITAFGEEIGAVGGGWGYGLAKGGERRPGGAGLFAVSGKLIRSRATEGVGAMDGKVGGVSTVLFHLREGSSVSSLKSFLETTGAVFRKEGKNVGV